MIRLLKDGAYKLIETKKQTKILIMDKNAIYQFWHLPVGEIIISTYEKDIFDSIFSYGRYRLYEVKKEKDLTDHMHLELFVGNGIWQGYLLPTGLPTEKKKITTIMVTEEIITKTLKIVNTNK